MSKRLAVFWTLVIAMTSWMGRPAHAAELCSSFPPVPLNTDAATDQGPDSSAVLATDGQGTWVAAWPSIKDLGGALGSDSDILFARSIDNGQTWGAPSVLNSNAMVDTGADGSPTLAADADGTFVAAWASKDDLGGTIGTDFDVLFARSTDHGATWSAPQPVSAALAAEDSWEGKLKLLTSGAGTWILTFVSDADLGGLIGSDSDVLFVRSTDGGQTWSEPAALAHPESPPPEYGDGWTDSTADLATDGAGNWLAAWASKEPLWGIGDDWDIIYSVSTDDGITWSPVQPITALEVTDTQLDGYVAAVSDSAGNWVVAWLSNNSLGGTIGGDADLLFTRSTDLGQTWSAPAPLNSTAYSDGSISDSSLVLAADNSGHMAAVWVSDVPGGSGYDSTILVALSADAGATWGDPMPIDPIAGILPGFSNQQPAVGTDGSGTWLITWRSDDDLGGTIGTDNDILYNTFEVVECPADLDPDCQIGAADLAHLLGAWGPNPGHPADLDGDSKVGAADLAILLGAWGPC